MVMCSTSYWKIKIHQEEIKGAGGTGMDCLRECQKRPEDIFFACEEEKHLCEQREEQVKMTIKRFLNGEMYWVNISKE